MITEVGFLVGKRREGSIGWSDVLMRQEGSFFALFVILSKKKISIIFLEGKELSDGWNPLVERLRGLGVVPIGGLKETRVLEVLLRVKGGLKVLWREKGVET